MNNTNLRKIRRGRIYQNSTRPANHFIKHLMCMQFKKNMKHKTSSSGQTRPRPRAVVAGVDWFPYRRWTWLSCAARRPLRWCRGDGGMRAPLGEVRPRLVSLRCADQRLSWMQPHDRLGEETPCITRGEVWQRGRCNCAALPAHGRGDSEGLEEHGILR